LSEQKELAGSLNEKSASLWKRLYVASVIAALVHLIAGLCMVTILRYGLDTADFADRLIFLTQHNSLWIMGWLTWNVAAVSILYFYFCFAQAHAYSNNLLARILRFAVLLTAGAMLIDISAEIIEMGILPDLAQKILAQQRINMYTEKFLTIHRTAVIMTGCLANGLYSISAALLIYVTRYQYKRSVQAAGWLVVTSGAWLSLACFTNSIAGMMLANVILIPALVVWQIGIALASDERSNHSLNH